MAALLAMDESLHMLFTSRRVIRKLLQHRGFSPVEDAWDASPEAFVKAYAEAPDYMTLTIRAWNGGILLLVFFPPDAKLKVQALREMCAYSEKCRCKHFIIAYRDQITPFAKQQIVSYRLDNAVRIECFAVPDLQYDRTDHEFVPQHRIVTPEEQEAILKQYRCKKEQLPKLLPSDPVGRFLGARGGQVIKITRPSPNGYFYDVYRVCQK